MVSPSQNYAEGDEAGLSVYQINDGHLDYFIRRTQNGCRLALRCKLKSIDYIVSEKELTIDPTSLLLRVRSDGACYYFEYQNLSELTDILEDGWHLSGRLDCSLMSTEVAGGFTGVVVGAYASAAREGDDVYADFRLLHYQKQ